MNKKYGISFVYITHDLGTARYIADNGRIMVMYVGEIIELNDITKAIKNPKHPYFQALIQAVPRPRLKNANGEKEELPFRSLDMPDLLDLPSGCRFNPRCIYHKDICEKEVPRLRELETGGFVACHRAEEVQEILRKKQV